MPLPGRRLRREQLQENDGATYLPNAVKSGAADLGRYFCAKYADAREAQRHRLAAAAQIRSGSLCLLDFGRIGSDLYASPTWATPLVGNGVPFLTFFPIVLVAAVVAGAFVGLSALLLSSMMATYFWLTPRDLAVETDDFAAMVSYWIASALIIAVAVLLRTLIENLVASETRAHVVAQEMKHCVGNMLAVILAIARQNSRGATNLTEFTQAFQDRMAALARAQDVIQEHPNLPTNLRPLITRVTEPFGEQRFQIEGPEVGVDPVIASSLALIVHELGTNAITYWSLSNPTGVVCVNWTANGACIVLTWIEKGGPQVAALERSGFGSKLLQSSFPSETGEARIEYDVTGVRCTLSFVGATASAEIASISPIAARMPNYR